MEEEKNRERKERIDTIFMYESRIKGNLQSFIIQGTTARRPQMTLGQFDPYLGQNGPELAQIWAQLTQIWAVRWYPVHIFRFVTFTGGPEGLF